MHRFTKKHSIAALVALSLSSVSSFAADPVLGGLNTDPFFYTSDQIIPANQEAMMGATGRPATTHSLIPHLPVYFGFFNTNYTYRFVSVVEQVMTMIGEGKHGLWRMQEAGTVREYLKSGKTGLPVNADLNSPANLATIQDSYSNFERAESWGFYRYPSNKVTGGKLNFIDLPITHAKYEGKYVNHKPIDLPSFYCTMSENDFPHALEAMTYVFAQPGANVVGPLGKSAGLDVRENYTNVLRLTHLPDARSWANIGKQGLDPSYTNWQAVDTKNTEAEYYLVERPFFNHPYLFLLAVYDNKNNKDFRYIRPAGAYYQSLGAKTAGLKTTLTVQPRFNIEAMDKGKNDDDDDHDHDQKTSSGFKKVVGLPVYGVHHPDRASFGGGGACPLKGGDWGNYPDPAGGSAWPTQYEEVTPLCDGVLVDIKFTANLDGKKWNDPGKYLANAARGSTTVTYHMQPGLYGVFIDPYNVNRGVTNSESMNIPAALDLHFPSVRPAVTYVPIPALPTIYANSVVSSKSKLAENGEFTAKDNLMAASSGMSPVGTSCKPIMN
ncbi:MAG: hypothetical protein ABI475_02135 [Methylophilaceae bacterium]